MYNTNYRSQAETEMTGQNDKSDDIHTNCDFVNHYSCYSLRKPHGND